MLSKTSIFRQYDWTTFHSMDRLLLVGGRVKPYLYFETDSYTLSHHFAHGILELLLFQSTGHSALQPDLSTQHFLTFVAIKSVSS